MLQSLFFTLLMIVMVGCGSNNSDSPENNSSSGNSTLENGIDLNGTATLIFPSGSSRTLTQNNEAYTIDILVLGPDNAPASSGTVKIAYPDKIKDGVDIGYFSASSAEVVNGHARFNYVGPQNLQERVNAGDKSTQFGFYLSDEPQNVAVFTFKYEPAPHQIILTNYDVDWNKRLADASLGLNSSTQLSFYIENDQKEKVADSDVISMKVSLMNGIATLKDTFGNSGTSLSFRGKNNISVTLSSKTVSGIVPIKVDATFKDANSKTQSLSKVFNMTILSGPPTAISISYAGTEIDKNKAKFIEKMIVTVTDKYFNNVNTQPAVSAALIAGYARDANISRGANTLKENRLYFTTADKSTATLNPSTNTLSVSDNVNLSKVDPVTDIAATFGNGYTYEASGKWDIASINGLSTINLGDDFNASAPVSGLGYAIGHNYRQDTCRDSQEWIGYVKVNNSDGDVLTKEGYVELDIYYDYYLTGKKVVLAVNILGKDVNSGVITRLGEARAHDLRSTGFNTDTISVPAGFDGNVTMPVHITDTPEWLRNANFFYTIKTSDKIQVNQVRTVGNVGRCEYGGVAFVEANITNNDTSAPGTITLDNILIGDEF